MRYTHSLVKRVRSVLLTRLGYIIGLRLKSGATQVSLAQEYGCTVHAIRAIVHNSYTSIALDRLLIVADGMGLDYTITWKSHDGHRDVSISLPAYDNDPVIAAAAAMARKLPKPTQSEHRTLM